MSVGCTLASGRVSQALLDREILDLSGTFVRGGCLIVALPRAKVRQRLEERRYRLVVTAADVTTGRF